MARPAPLHASASPAGLSKNVTDYNVLYVTLQKSLPFGGYLAVGGNHGLSKTLFVNSEGKKVQNGLIAGWSSPDIASALRHLEDRRHRRRPDRQERLRSRWRWAGCLLQRLRRPHRRTGFLLRQGAAAGRLQPVVDRAARRGYSVRQEVIEDRGPDQPDGAVARGREILNSVPVSGVLETPAAPCARGNLLYNRVRRVREEEEKSQDRK